MAMAENIITIADLSHRPEWHRRAACRGTGIDAFFPERGQSTTAAKAICGTCEVRQQCIDDAMANGDKFGIWAAHRSANVGRCGAVGDRWRIWAYPFPRGPEAAWETWQSSRSEAGVTSRSSIASVVAGKPADAVWRQAYLNECCIGTGSERRAR